MRRRPRRLVAPLLAAGLLAACGEAEGTLHHARPLEPDRRVEAVAADVGATLTEGGRPTGPSSEVTGEGRLSQAQRALLAGPDLVRGYAEAIAAQSWTAARRLSSGPALTFVERLATSGGCGLRFEAPQVSPPTTVEVVGPGRFSIDARASFEVAGSRSAAIDSFVLVAQRDSSWRIEDMTIGRRSLTSFEEAARADGIEQDDLNGELRLVALEYCVGPGVVRARLRAENTGRDDFAPPSSLFLVSRTQVVPLDVGASTLPVVPAESEDTVFELTFRPTGVLADGVIEMWIGPRGELTSELWSLPMRPIPFLEPLIASAA